MSYPDPSPSLRSPAKSKLREAIAQRLPDPWTAAILLLSVIIAIPVVAIASSLLSPTTEVWQRLVETVLPRYVKNSLYLMIGVGIGTIVMGVGTAWLVALCRFPGRRVFEWALLLPLAAPAYVLAYTYTDLLDVAGPLQTHLRSLFGWSVRDYWFPQVRSLGGAIAMLSLVLYPYIYLPARVAFLEQSKSTLDASRSLGRGPWQTFFTVALPLARPTIVGGAALALMETLNDFGTVQFFGVETFSTGIYRTWFNMGERAAAAQLAAVLLLFVLAIVAIERWTRGRTHYFQSGNPQGQPLSYPLGFWGATAAMLTCSLPVGLGFVVPGWALASMAFEEAGYGLEKQFWTYARHSFVMGAIAAALAVAIGILMAYGQRLRPNRAMRWGTRVAAMGYAIPGAVIAVGILIPVSGFDRAVDNVARSLFDISTGLLLSGTIVALLFAYVVRFLAVSFNTVEAGLLRIRPNLDDAARSLGCTPVETLAKVHAPLMVRSIATAAMFVFVDVVKELPATLVLRPFNFDTLATRVYRLASDERLAESAPGSLAIAAVGMIPVIVLIWTLQNRRSRQTAP
ncbi:MAG: iron ABC transporter permease [Cyanobacteria bacterium J06639_1]